MKMMKNIMTLALAFTFVFVAGGQEASAYPADENIMPVPSNTAHTDSCGDCHTDSNKNDDVYGFEAGQMCAPCHQNVEDGHAYSGQGTAEKPSPVHGGHNVYVDDSASVGAHDDCVGCHVNPADATDLNDDGMINDPVGPPVAEDDNAGPYVPTADTDNDALTPKVSYLTPHMNGATPMFGAEDCGTCHEGAMVAANAETDPDGDGLTAEYDNDPAVAAPADQDSDNDGMTDLDEVNYNARRKASLDINNPDTDGDGVYDGFDDNPTTADQAPADATVDQITLEEGELTVTGTLVGYDATKGTAVVSEDAAYGTVTVVDGVWTYTQDVFTIAAQATVDTVDSFTIQYADNTGALVAQTVEVTVGLTETTGGGSGSGSGSGSGDGITPGGDDTTNGGVNTDASGTNPETGGTAGLALSVAVTTVSAAGLVVTRKKN